jgi:hypothetical protein
MELLLNLAWLLLALPAYWLWHARRTSQKSSLQCVLSLACLLVVLFPVISATDDMQAMRAEMEESSSSRRSLRQTNSSEKSLLSGWHSPGATSSPVTNPLAQTEDRLISVVTAVSLPTTILAEPSGRAPPRLLLA